MLKKLTKFLLFVSILLVVGSYLINLENRSFDAAGNIFTSSNNEKKPDKSRNILSDDFWTNGKFNF